MMDVVIEHTCRSHTDPVPLCNVEFRGTRIVLIEWMLAANETKSDNRCCVGRFTVDQNLFGRLRNLNLPSPYICSCGGP